MDTILSFSMRDKQNLPALLQQVIDFQPDDRYNSMRGFHFFSFFLSCEREREREREGGPKWPNNNKTITI